MSYRTLGHSGLQVSTLTLGTMMFGEQTSTEESLRIIDSPDDWMAVVKLRNRLVHDYPLTREARFAKLVEAARATETLRAAAQRALTYVDKKEWLA